MAARTSDTVSIRRTRPTNVMSENSYVMDGRGEDGGAVRELGCTMALVLNKVEGRRRHISIQCVSGTRSTDGDL